MAEEKKQNNIVRSMPCSLEAEQAVLGAIISDNEVAIRIVSDLVVDDFYAKNHKTIFEQIQKLSKENKPIDIVMLASSLDRDGKLAEVGGVTTLDELVDSIPSTANVDYYVNILNQNALRRRLIRECRGIVDKSYEEEDAEKVLAYAESQIYNVAEKKDSSSLLHVSNSTVEVMERIEKAYRENGSQGGLKVGFKNLDEATNGFLPGQMIVLAARPGCGKTSFVMNMVANLASKADSQEVVAVFNLEMSAGELVMRLISNIARLDSRDLLGGLENKDNLDRVWSAQDILQRSNIYIDDTAAITTEQIMSKCRRLKMQKGRLDLVVIDYLQLITSSDSKKSRLDSVTDISRYIKILAKELKVPVIILSQMSRSIEKRDDGDKDPKLSDLRDSGAIEQDADIVAFLTDGDFNVDAGNAAIRLMIAKHRNGSVCELYFEWDKSKMRFRPTIATRIAPTAKTDDGDMQSAGGIDIPLPDAPDDSGDFSVGGVDISDLY
ncbi:MAG: replicative DNA helicase [Clostridia bacterium]|nr:replicative DNA helicase [Clostridia bacterium]